MVMEAKEATVVAVEEEGSTTTATATSSEEQKTTKPALPASKATVLKWKGMSSIALICDKRICIV